MWDYQIEQMKKQSDQIEGAQQADAKVMATHITGHAKILSQQIMAEAQKATAAKKASSK
jgi:hypothetical protein